MTFSRPSSALLLTLGLTVLGGLVLVACPTDFCKRAPSCDGVTAINCEPGTCASPPCSSGADVRDCPTDTTCHVQPGAAASLKYVRDRALCVSTDAGLCDPATSGPPSCDGNHILRGCSGYGVFIAVPCGQAGLYFESSVCCLGIIDRVDSGTPDAGSGDAGVDDAGSPDGGP